MMKVLEEFDNDCYDFKFSRENVESVLTCPDESEIYLSKYLLSLKRFDNVDKKRTYLIVLSAGDTVHFCYWMPSEIATGPKTSLIDKHIDFIRRFGEPVTIKKQTDVYFEMLPLGAHAATLPDIIKIAIREFIPTRMRWAYDSNDLTLLHFGFVINCNVYFTWLYSIETTQLKIPVNRFKFFQDMNRKGKWDGSTRFKILKPINVNDRESPQSKSILEEFVTIDVIKAYTPFFKHAIQYDIELGEGKTFNYQYQPKSTDFLCAACGSEDLSAEHIFPIWMRGYFPNEKVHLFHLTEPDETFANDGDDLYGLTLNRICLNCNRGWMSRLENAVKGIFVHKERFATKISELALNNGSLSTLSQWVLLKVLSLSLKNGISLHQIPPDTFQSLSSGRVDPDFLIEVCEDPDYDFTFFGSENFDDWMLMLKNTDFDTAKDLSMDLFSSVLQVGNFIFRVSYFKDSGSLYRFGSFPKTDVIFPLGKSLPYYSKDEQARLWENIPEPEMRRHLFTMSIGLTDHL